MADPHLDAPPIGDGNGQVDEQGNGTGATSLDSVDSKAIQKSSAEMLVLSLLEHHERHGYEIAKLIEQRSDARLQFHIASLYPLLYRLEGRGWVEGRWVERAGERRKRFYALTPRGHQALAAQRQSWREMVEAISRVADIHVDGITVADLGHA